MGRFKLSFISGDIYAHRRGLLVHPLLTICRALESKIQNKVDIKVDARKRLFQFVLQHGNRTRFNP